MGTIQRDMNFKLILASCAALVVEVELMVIGQIPLSFPALVRITDLACRLALKFTDGVVMLAVVFSSRV